MKTIKLTHKERVLLNIAIYNKYIYEGFEYFGKTNWFEIKEIHNYDDEHYLISFTTTDGREFSRTKKDTISVSDITLWDTFKEFLFSHPEMLFFKSNALVKLIDNKLKTKNIEISDNKTLGKLIKFKDVEFIAKYIGDNEFVAIKYFRDITPDILKEFTKELGNIVNNTFKSPSQLFDKLLLLSRSAGIHLSENIKALTASNDGEININFEIDSEEWGIYRPSAREPFFVTPLSDNAKRTPREVWNAFIAETFSKLIIIDRNKDAERLARILLVLRRNEEIGCLKLVHENPVVGLYTEKGYQVLFGYCNSEHSFFLFSQNEEALKALKNYIVKKFFIFYSVVLNKVDFLEVLMNKENPLAHKGIVVANYYDFYGYRFFIDGTEYSILGVSEPYVPFIQFKKYQDGAIYVIYKNKDNDTNELADINSRRRRFQSVVTTIKNYMQNYIQEEDEKLEPEEEDDEPTREHTIDDDFDVVDNATNTDENNHGGSSVALEVEDGEPREEGNDGAAEQNCPADAVGSQQSNSNSGNTADELSASSAGEGLDTATDGGNGSNLSAEDKQAPHTAVGSSAPGTAGEIPAVDAMGNIAENTDTESKSQKRPGEVLLSLLEKKDNGRQYNETPSNPERSLFEEYTKDVDDSFFKDIKKVFKKIVSTTTNGEKTPEIDKKLLVKNIVTFRNPYDSLKRNKKNDKVLLLVDTSGSMSNFYELVPYFMKLTTILPEIIVVENENMLPVAVTEKGKTREIKYPENMNYDETTIALDVYKGLLKRYNIRYIINFTDFDGVEITEMLLKKTKARMVIMDVFRCKVLDYIPRKDKSYRYLPDSLKPYKSLISYWYGVGDWNGVKTVLNEEL